jgi:hypothetical protein
MALTQVDQGLLGTYAQYTGFKNRILNGQMVIDQRNAGASVTPANGQYLTDRWNAALSQASKFSAQQNAGSVTPPAGFPNYLGITSLSAYSITASDVFNIIQPLEGFTTADLAWGTASAQTVTLSFWVRSSLTGTFGGSLANYALTRSYPFTFTISSANTWEQKSITIAGDTSGTWVGATNAGSMYVRFNLGTGSTYSGTAGAWASADYRSATGATSVVGTNGATFYITGIQLEKGSTATSFDYRPYGTELQLCQRYYQIIRSNAPYQFYTLVTYESASTAWGPIPLKVSMRSQPTTLVSGSFTVSYGVQGTYINDTNQTGAEVAMIGWGSSGSGGTVGYAPYIRSNNSTTSYMSFSAEL